MMCIFILFHYGGPPGAGRFERPVEIARAFAREGAEVRVFFASFHHLAAEAVEEESVDEYGVRYVPIACREYEGNGPGRFGNMVDFARGAVRWRRRCGGDVAGPDVVIGSMPHPLVGLAARRIARESGGKLIIEIRDLWPESLVELGGVSRFHPVAVGFGWMVRRGYRAADGMVSVLPRAVEYLRTLRGGGPEIPMAAIGNGVSPDGIRRRAATGAAPAAHREAVEGQRAAGRLVIGYAGAMGPPNALRRLMELQECLEATSGRDLESIPYHFLLVGSGPEREELARFAERREECVFTVLPALSKEEVPAFLRLVDAGVIVWNDVPLYRFGVSPNKVWEYFALELPVLWVGAAANDPVEEAGGGVSVPPHHPEQLDAAARELAALPRGEREAMGRRGAAYLAEHGDWARLGERYRECVAEVRAAGESGREPSHSSGQ